jgi:hypothetical protein
VIYYWAMVWMIGGSYPGNFSHHRVQTSSGSHPASYPMGTRGSFPRGVKLTTHLHPVPRSRMHGAIPPLPHMSTWHSSQSKKKHRDNFTSYLLLFISISTAVICDMTCAVDIALVDKEQSVNES